MLNKSYLLTGGNMGNREENLSKAAGLLGEECGAILLSSSLYETAAWGITDQAAFLNQALLIETPLNARQLMRKILKVEKKMGRERKKKYGPRIIDIDIIFFNNELHNYPLLQLPHPQMHNRRFVLTPLAEIAPGFVHPVFNKTVEALLQTCSDPLEVKKYS